MSTIADPGSPILTKDIITEQWEEFKPVNLSAMKYYPPSYAIIESQVSLSLCFAEDINESSRSFMEVK